MNRRLLGWLAFGMLAACSSGNGEVGSTAGFDPVTSPSTEGSDVAAAPETPPSVDCSSGDPSGEVEVWHAMGGNVAADHWERWEQQLEQERDVDLTIRSFGSDIEIVQALSRTDTSDWPELVLSGERALRVLWDSGRFVSPTDCDANAADGLLPVAAATYTLDGELAALPFGVSTLVLVVDLKEIRTAGLDPDKPPATLEQMLDWSKRVVSTGSSPHGLVLTDHCASLVLSEYTAKRGELEGVPSNGREGFEVDVRYDTPDNAVDFAELRAAVDEGHALYIGPNGSGFDDLARLSPVDGDAAMTIHTSAALGDVISLMEGGNFPGAELGVMPLPGPGAGASVGGNALYLVAQDDADAQARAWMVASWLHDPVRLAELAAATGYVPAVDAAVDEPVLQDAWRRHPQLKVAYEQATSTPPTLAMAGLAIGPFDERDHVMYDLCDRIITGDGDIGAQLRDAELSVNGLLATYSDLRADGSLDDPVDTTDSASGGTVSGAEGETVTGTVLCESGAPVVGVWVDAANGGSGFADRTEKDVPRTTFRFTLPAGGGYAVHVGCGGSEPEWAGAYFSPSVVGSGHVFSCEDQTRSDAGVCTVD